VAYNPTDNTVTYESCRQFCLNELAPGSPEILSVGYGLDVGDQYACASYSDRVADYVTAGDTDYFFSDVSCSVDNPPTPPTCGLEGFEDASVLVAYSPFDSPTTYEFCRDYCLDQSADFNIVSVSYGINLAGQTQCSCYDEQVAGHVTPADSGAFFSDLQCPADNPSAPPTCGFQGYKPTLIAEIEVESARVGDMSCLPNILSCRIS
jgi:hypothetical protein